VVGGGASCACPALASWPKIDGDHPTWHRDPRLPVWSPHTMRMVANANHVPQPSLTSCDQEAVCSRIGLILEIELNDPSEVRFVG
jgi:hypothetical protein